MEWVKTLQFEFDDKDHNDQPVIRICTCRWRSDGVCYYTISRRYAGDEARSKFYRELDDDRWERFLVERTDVKPAPEEAFDRSFIWNKISYGGRTVDTGYEVDGKVLQQVLADPLVVKLRQVEAAHGG